MIEIRITGNTAAETAEEIKALAGVFGVLDLVRAADEPKEPAKKTSKKAESKKTEIVPTTEEVIAATSVEPVPTSVPTVVPTTAPIPTVEAAYTQDRVIAGAISFKDKAPQNLGLLQSKLAEFKVMSLQELNQEQLNAFAQWLIASGEVL